MNKQEELEYFKKWGICPYVGECSDSIGCHGDKDMFQICRSVKVVDKKQEDNCREVVQFT